MQQITDAFTSLFTKGDLSGHLGGRVLTALALYGAYNLLPFVTVPLKAVWRHALRPRKNLLSRYGGDWAVVTGASDGLGEAYCYELAKSGFNIILVSRTPEKLDRVALMLREEYGVKTRVV